MTLDFFKNDLSEMSTIPKSLTNAIEKIMSDALITKRNGTEYRVYIILPTRPNCCLRSNQNFLTVATKYHILNNYYNNEPVFIYTDSFCVCFLTFPKEEEGRGLMTEELNGTLSSLVDICNAVKEDCEINDFSHFDFVEYQCNNDSVLYVAIITGCVMLVLVLFASILGVYICRYFMKKKDLLEGLTPEE
eukprot:Pgem_evm1s6414